MENTCKVCGRNFKLVGEAPSVLANHGFKKDEYGQSEPCLGSGWTPEKSLSGAKDTVKWEIDWWTGVDGFEKRVEQFKETLKWLEGK